MSLRNWALGATAFLAAATTVSYQLAQNPPEDRRVCPTSPDQRGGRVTQVARGHFTEAFGGTFHYKFEQPGQPGQPGWAHIYPISSEYAETAENQARHFCRTGVRPGTFRSKALETLVRRLP